MNSTNWKRKLWPILAVSLLMLTIGFALWKTQREWKIAHDCQCGAAYGRSSGDYSGSAILQNALFIAPAVVGLIFFAPAGLILGVTIAGASLLFLLLNRTSSNPYAEFQNLALLVVIVLNLALSSISLYLSLKRMRTG
jgi:hypothetical protein